MRGSRAAVAVALVLASEAVAQMRHVNSAFSFGGDLPAGLVEWSPGLFRSEDSSVIVGYFGHQLKGRGIAGLYDEMRAATRGVPETADLTKDGFTLVSRIDTGLTQMRAFVGETCAGDAVAAVVSVMSFPEQEIAAREMFATLAASLAFDDCGG